MLLTITTTQRPATDLSRLLRADPDDVRTCRFPFGEALVFFPQHDSARCTAAVLVQPATDEPRTPLASLATVLATVFESTLRGEAPDQLKSASQGRHFEVQAPTRPCVEIEERARRLFAPLGYEVELGADGSLWLSNTTDLSSLLAHLCVLLPLVESGSLPDGNHVLDELLARSGEWLTDHPEYSRIATQGPEASVRQPDSAQHRVHKPRLCTRHVAN